MDARKHDRFQLRGHVRAVEIGHIVGNVEQFPYVIWICGDDLWCRVHHEGIPHRNLFKNPCRQCEPLGERISKKVRGRGERLENQL